MNNNKQILPLLILFILINIILFSLHTFLNKNEINFPFLFIANVVLFAINIVVLLFQRKALTNKNPNVFVRSILSGTMIKMGLIGIAFVSYIFVMQKNINKPAIYISIVLYFIYLFAEVFVLLQMNKKINA